MDRYGGRLLGVRVEEKIRSGMVEVDWEVRYGEGMLGVRVEERFRSSKVEVDWENTCRERFSLYLD